MTNLAQAKTLGGLGSILILLTAVPDIGWVLGIVGFIMTLIAIKEISETVREPKIYRNMLISVLLAIAGIIVGTIVLVAAVYKVLGMGSFVGSQFILPSNITAGDWIGVAAIVVAGLLAVCAFLLTSAVYFRRSVSSISSRLNIGTFGTAGLLYLIGAATAVIGVGFIIMLVAEIFLAVSFFSINEKAPPAVQAASIPGTG